MTPRPPSNALGAFLIVVAATGFGVLGPAVELADRAGVSSLTLATWRAGVGAIVVVLFVAVRAAGGTKLWRPWREIPGRDRFLVSMSAVTNAILNLAAFVAFLRIGIALTLLIFYVYPAIVALASTVWFRERLDRLRWASLGISVTGALLVVAGAGNLGSLDALGLGLALLAALGQTYYALAAQRGFRQVPGPQAAVSTMGGAAVIYLIVALVIGRLPEVGQPLASIGALLPVLVAGVIGAGLATVCFIAGVRLLGAARATILSTLEPVVGVTLAAILFGAVPTPVQLLGGAFIIVAGIVLQLPSGEVAEHEAVAELSS